MLPLQGAERGLWRIPIIAWGVGQTSGKGGGVGGVAGNCTTIAGT